MASIPLTINQTSPDSISVIRLSDNQECFTSYNGSVLRFVALLDGINHTYQVSVTKNGCQAQSNFSLACSDTVNTQPEFSVTVDQPSCSNGTLGPAYIRIRNAVNASKFYINTGASYTGNNDCTTGGLAITNSAADYVVSSPPASGQSQTYTIRAYNGTYCGEWRDHTVTVSSPVCSVQPTTILAFDYEQVVNSGNSLLRDQNYYIKLSRAEHAETRIKIKPPGGTYSNFNGFGSDNAYSVNGYTGTKGLSGALAAGSEVTIGIRPVTNPANYVELVIAGNSGTVSRTVLYTG